MQYSGVVGLELFASNFVCAEVTYNEMELIMTSNIFSYYQKLALSDLYVDSFESCAT